MLLRSTNYNCYVYNYGTASFPGQLTDISKSRSESVSSSGNEVDFGMCL